MSMFGVRRRLKAGVKRALATVERRARSTQNTDLRDVWSSRDKADAPVPVSPFQGTKPEPQPQSDPAPEGLRVIEVNARKPDAVEAVQTGGGLTVQAVQDVLDEMIRPALQGDGGDITLIKVEATSVHVQLVGACSTCPSSMVTMKMGVEALLKEEFPQMTELIQVG